MCVYSWGCPNFNFLVSKSVGGKTSNKQTNKSSFHQLFPIPNTPEQCSHPDILGRPTWSKVRPSVPHFHLNGFWLYWLPAHWLWRLKPRAARVEAAASECTSSTLLFLCICCRSGINVKRSQCCFWGFYRGLPTTAFKKWKTLWLISPHPTVSSRVAQVGN